MPPACPAPPCACSRTTTSTNWQRLLAGIRAKAPRARMLVVTESVFSMDGDLCPLRGIVGLVEAHGALLLLDEAHGFGVLGESGMGLAEREQLQQRVTFQMGTLSKAAGLCRRLPRRVPRVDRPARQPRPLVHLFHRPAAGPGARGPRFTAPDPLGGGTGAAATAAAITSPGLPTPPPRSSPASSDLTKPP